MKKIIIPLLALLMINSAFSQRPETMANVRDGKITGTIIGEDKNPIEYATVSLYNQKDSSLVSGSISKADGKFEITDVKPGKYYAEVSFVGFDKITVSDISVTPPTMYSDIGKVTVLPSAKSINEVEVIGNRPRVEYKIDKKIVSISSDLTSTGGTAADALENVPSIQTDIEGNVTLRGSSSFTVYIDGRPSILDGSDALQQIPASAIENIEIITNPSAKYEAEGTAGIINVILKKKKGQGINGIVNASIGSNNKYGTDILLNYRAQKFNIYGGFDFNHRNYDMEFESYEKRFDERYVDTLYRDINREMHRERESLGFKLGVDYYFNDKTSISVSGQYDYRTGDSQNDSWRDDTYHDTLINYYSSSFSERVSNNFELNFDYITKFNESGHQLTAAFNVEGEAGESGRSEGLLEYVIDPITNTQSLSTNYLMGDINPEYELRFKVDYTYPFSEYGKFESGIQFDADFAEYNYYFQEKDFDTEQWKDVDSLNQILEIDRSVYAAYAIYANRLPLEIDFQAGLRAEYTNREVRTDKKYPVKRPDFFPSVHFSKKIDDKNQLMAGYSRRIQRPREWALNPVRRYIDSESARAGNPALKPEYSSTYEVNYQYSVNRSFISLELYHKHNTNLIERTDTTTPDFIRVWTSINTGESYASGFEIMGNLDIKKIITLNASYSLYNYRIKSSLQTNDLDADREDFTWRGNLSATYIAPWKGRFQVNSFINGASITAQGERGGFFVTSLGYRQDLFDRKLTATIKVRDIFQSMNFSRTTISNIAIIESEFRRESPVFSLTLSYKINNYKTKERGGPDGGGGTDTGGGDDVF